MEESSEENELSKGGGLLSHGWRRLPTAWIHLLWVECFHIYMAAASWLRLINNVNTRCAMMDHYKATAGVERYFSSLYLAGSTEELRIDFRNVTDPFFLAASERGYPSVFYNGTTLVLPSTHVDGANVPWLVLSWMLPAAAAVLLCYVVVNFISEGIWSFESAAYLHFTWHITRRPGYRAIVAVMAAIAATLPVLWVVQIVMYDLEDQWRVLQHSLLSGFILLFALDMLAFPNAPVHFWEKSPGFLDIAFKRSVLHLLLSSNKSFGMKVVDALWVANFGDHSRLQRYLADPDKAGEVLELCQLAQQNEAQEHVRRLAEDARGESYL